jgi:hypothetical protein
VSNENASESVTIWSDDASFLLRPQGIRYVTNEPRLCNDRVTKEGDRPRIGKLKVEVRP